MVGWAGAAVLLVGGLICLQFNSWVSQVATQQFPSMRVEQAPGGVTVLSSIAPTPPGLQLSVYNRFLLSLPLSLRFQVLTARPAVATGLAALASDRAATQAQVAGWAHRVL